MKVFLGGTCNGSKWRESLIPHLEIDYFNPVVEDWTPDDQERELVERAECDICLYVITPKMNGVYSIAEAVDDSHRKGVKTVFSLWMKEKNGKEFTGSQIKSLMAVGQLIERNGGIFDSHFTEYRDIKNLAKILNEMPESEL